MLFTFIKIIFNLQDTDVRMLTDGTISDKLAIRTSTVHTSTIRTSTVRTSTTRAPVTPAGFLNRW